jgi:uncharacterized lipoprotein YajG
MHTVSIMLKHLTSLFLVALLVGCATPATQQAMSISAQDVGTTVNPQFKGQLAIGSVTGGKDTNPLWSSQVDSQSFKGALDKSISVAGYQAASGTSGKYRVDAVLQDLDQPFMGFTLDVVSKVVYTVSGDGKQKQFPVSATGSASTSDAFVAIERLRIANERSIKENIKQFIQSLGQSVGW